MGKSAPQIPLTLIILVFTFGALVAAGIPVLLALTSVLATLGLLGPISLIAPVDASVMHVVLLVGIGRGRLDQDPALPRRSARSVPPDVSRTLQSKPLPPPPRDARSSSPFDLFFATNPAISNFALATMSTGNALGESPDRLADRRPPLKPATRWTGRAARRTIKRPGQAGIWSRVLDRVLRRLLLSALVSAGLRNALAASALAQTERHSAVPRDFLARSAAMQETC